ncbi:MAG: HAMP domain-containing histidine kinase [Bacilli bacterium]|nr:HAMP domain-containing histidine kinase [Bacilli bacterium]
MNIIKDDILNIILIFFPILIYFIYNCYRELTSEKYNGILFNLSLFISLYLCIKYGESNSYIKLLLFLNIPVLLAYTKKERKIAMLLSTIIILYTKYTLDKPIIVLLIQYVSFYTIYVLSTRKKISNKKLILVISLLQGFYMSIQMFLYNNTNITDIIEIVLSILIFYTIPFILLFLFDLADNVSSLYLTIREFEQEKQLRNSLFKITHEVKNPIAVCKGYLEMLDINNKEKIKKYIPIIKQEIDRSINIMSDFMEFNKIKIDKDILDINLLLEDITEEFKIILKSKKIKLNSRITQDEIYLNGDYNRLKQVFINLIKNSIESMEKEGNIDIITHILKDYYYIEITDNGCGMDEYTLNHIKELFFTTKEKGSGLGVSLSNEIIKAHNGTIEYKSKPNKGTKVVVKLPITMI